MIADHVQKVLGALSAMVGAVISFAAAGGLNQIVGARELQILGLLSVVLGAATTASGVTNTAKVKVAEAMQDAINSTPPKQAGFARVPLLVTLLMTLLAGCALLGVPTPNTLNERVAAAYVSVTTVRQETLSLLQSGKITATDAKNIESQADNARAGIDIASQLETTNPTQASDRLTVSLSVLQALETYLTQHGNK